MILSYFVKAKRFVERQRKFRLHVRRITATSEQPDVQVDHSFGTYTHAGARNLKSGVLLFQVGY